MNRTTFILIFIILFIACKKDNSVEKITFGWEEDLGVFSKTLKESHKNLFFQLPRADFENEIDRLILENENLNDEEIIIDLFKLLSRVGDAHTSISLNSVKCFSVFPFSIQYLSDGIFLSKINSDNTNHLMKKITAIDNIPIDEALELIKPVITFENESQYKNKVPWFINIAEALYYCNITSLPNQVSLTFETGETITLKTSSASMTSVYDIVETPLYLSKEDDIYWFDSIPEINLIYIQYNSCSQKNDLTFEDFSKQVFEKIDNTTEPAIVIDLRLNGGGNSTIAQPLIDGLTTRVDKGELNSSDIYVIIGRKTFSSALINAYQLKNSLHPVLIGEPTGGKPNAYGEVLYFVLPNSKLKVNYSTKYFQYTDGDESSLEPDLLIELSSRDILNGVDPVLNYIFTVQQSK